MEEHDFRTHVQKNGYPEPQHHEFAANMSPEMHTHEQSVMLLITGGSFTLALEDETTTYGPGEWCELSANTIHTERTGPDGATALICRK